MKLHEYEALNYAPLLNYSLSYRAVPLLRGENKSGGVLLVLLEIYFSIYSI